MTRTSSPWTRCSRLLAALALALVSTPAWAQTFWHAGNFRTLPATPGDNSFVPFVSNLSHPSGGYGELTDGRRDDFNAFVTALFNAIDDSLADGDTGDWCGVQDLAAEAGYSVQRFYDVDSGRWFIYGRDITSFGHAYFFINPFAKNNIVIEVPHEPIDQGTAQQGANLFIELAARALIINKEHRCSDSRDATCVPSTVSTAACNGSYRRSDVAHNQRNTFYLLHTRFSSRDSATKFVQLHGYSSRSETAIIADATTNDVSTSSVSKYFAERLRLYTSGDVLGCQDDDDNEPPSGLCATRNVQGRYTHGSPDACSENSANESNRFLHVEQSLGLRTNGPSATNNWMDVKDALADTWGDCDMNNGATDCTLGPVQTRYEGRSCSP